MIINTAGQNIGAQMVDASDGSAFTGTVSAFVTVDGGTQAAGGGVVTHEGNGYHDYTPTQAETNGAHIAFTFTGTGAIPVTVEVYTTEVLATSAQITALNDFDPASDTVANVTLVATTTTNTDMRGTDGANTTTPPNSTAIEAAANAALVALHLDHLLAVDYNPASQPGVATALLNELIQSSGGVSQFTATALEQTSNTGDLLFDGVTGNGSTSTLIELGAGASSDNDFYKHERVVVDNESRLCLAYDGATTTLTLNEALINGAPTNNTPIQIRSGGHMFAAAMRFGYTDDTVFINNIIGQSGTVQEINGIQDNPSDNISDATTIADNHAPPISKFDLSPGLSITPTQTYTNWQWLGRAATINFNNQQYPNNTFERHFYAGVISSATASQYRMLVGQVTAAGMTTPMNAVHSQINYLGDLTFNATGDFFANDCVTNGQTFDFGAAVSTGTAEIVRHSGDVTFDNLTGTQDVFFAGKATITLNASCTGGTLRHSGDILVINNGSTVVTGKAISEIHEERSNVDSVLNNNLTESTSGNISTNLSTFFDNADSAPTTQVVDDVGGGGGGGTDWTASERNEIRGRLGVTGTTSAGGNTPTLALQSSIDDVQGATFDTATDSLEAIRNRGDVAWITGGGGGGGDATEAKQDTIIANQAAIDAKIDIIDTVVDGIDIKVDDIPTNSEFNARTLPSADYFVVTDYTAPDNAGIAANGVAIGNLSIPTTAQIWSEPTRTLTAFGFTLDVNIQSINGVTIVGNGNSTPFDVS